MLNSDNTKSKKSTSQSTTRKTTSNNNSHSTTASSKSNTLAPSLQHITDSLNDQTLEDWSHISNGMMFICNKDTMDECYKLKLLGLPKYYLDDVQSLEPNKSALFLFNSSSRMLHGILKAASFGGENLVPSAWNEDYISPRYSRYPAQVKFQTAQEYPPIHENAFKHMFPEGRRVHKLSKEQVHELIDIFVSKSKPNGSKKPSKLLPSKPKQKAKKIFFPPAPKENPWKSKVTKKRPDPTPASLSAIVNAQNEYKGAPPQQPMYEQALKGPPSVPGSYFGVSSSVDHQASTDDEVKSVASSASTGHLSATESAQSSDNGVEIDGDGFQKVTHNKSGKTTKHKKKRGSLKKMKQKNASVENSPNAPKKASKSSVNNVTTNAGVDINHKVPQKTRKKKKRRDGKKHRRASSSGGGGVGGSGNPLSGNNPVEDMVGTVNGVLSDSPQKAKSDVREGQDHSAVGEQAPKPQPPGAHRYLKPIGHQRFDTPAAQMTQYVQFGPPREPLDPTNNMNSSTDLGVDPPLVNGEIGSHSQRAAAIGAGGISARQLDIWSTGSSPMFGSGIRANSDRESSEYGFDSVGQEFLPPGVRMSSRDTSIPNSPSGFDRHQRTTPPPGFPANEPKSSPRGAYNMDSSQIPAFSERSQQAVSRRYEFSEGAQAINGSGYSSNYANGYKRSDVWNSSSPLRLSPLPNNMDPELPFDSSFKDRHRGLTSASQRSFDRSDFHSDLYNEQFGKTSERSFIDDKQPTNYDHYPRKQHHNQWDTNHEQNSGRGLFLRSYDQNPDFERQASGQSGGFPPNGGGYVNFSRVTNGGTSETAVDHRERVGGSAARDPWAVSASQTDWSHPSGGSGSVLLDEFGANVAQNDTGASNFNLSAFVNQSTSASSSK